MLTDHLYGKNCDLKILKDENEVLSEIAAASLQLDCFVRAREFLKLRRRKRSIWPQVAAKAFTIELRLEDQA